jgi:hypothetical protein
MKKGFILCVLLLAVSGSAMAAPTKIRVLLWSEQTEPRDVYPKGINGALAMLTGNVLGAFQLCGRMLTAIIPQTVKPNSSA